PKCGAPIKVSIIEVSASSKKIKTQIVLGIVITLGSLFLTLLTGNALGLYGFVGGGIWTAISLIRKWWHHG
ncbi:hypothetical protein C9926_00920, partial [Sulfurovum lithotrophicum]